MKAQDIVEDFFKAPAIVLEEGVELGEKIQDELVSKLPLKQAEEYVNTLGPGLITGAADDDPSGIATYSQAGAQYGFQLLWLALFTFPLMAVVQEMCARLALVTGQGLAANIRERYPHGVLILCTTLLFAVNTFNLGADLGAMAKAMQLLFPSLDFTFLVVSFALVSLMLQVFTTYARYARYLKYCTLALLSYVAAAFVVQIDWTAVARYTLVPSITFSTNQILLICAVLGTTISPYLFFWQTAQEVEEEILQGKNTLELRQGTSDIEIKRMRIDVWSGMFFSNLVMFFIIAVCGATLYVHGITTITSADEAAAALRPLAGEFAYLLFALGIIGTGMLAVPVLAGSTSYALSESFAWDMGLYRKLNEAYAFYGVIIVSMLLGIAFNVIGIDPIKALIYSAIGNGLIAPVLLFFVVRLSSDASIMGELINTRLITLLGWSTVVLMALSGSAAIVALCVS
ncbi:divalent metal cation transporter [bacterium]|nr:divalent metal cation transporter [bacterium]